VYLFISRIKDLASTKGEEMLRLNLPSYFHRSVFEWWVSELTDLERDLLREVTLEQWYTQLIKRFKERAPVTMKKL